MVRSRTIGRKIRAFLAADPRRQWLVIEAAASLLVARIALSVMSFRRMSREFGEFVAPAGSRAAPPATPDVVSMRVIEDVRWSVRATAPFMPFRALCLQQAMAAQSMLRRRKIASTMHFGAGRDESGSMIAHAWLETAGVEITGLPVPTNIVEIGRFVR